MRYGIAVLLLTMLMAGATRSGAAPPESVARAVLGPHAGVGFALLSLPKVQQELTLSPGQRAQVEQQRQELLRLSTPDPEATEAPTDADQRRIADRQEALQDRAVTSLLDAPQQRRLRQILLQLRGPGLLLRPELVADLKLTAEQQSRIRSIVSHANMLRRAQSAGPQPADTAERERRAASAQALRKETEDRVIALLTPEQKRRRLEIVGEPFAL